ncbi:hypothetical protein [Streptomyces sp. NPDC090022]|uniref:hypothetical protein n=1 Tax=Streptomyces sp. NPDC090022 TaxID=3365920 RepID=UPI0037FDD11D
MPTHPSRSGRRCAATALALALAGGLLTAVTAPAHAHAPVTCVQGYVPRAAYEGDLVCVTPEIRDRTARENQLGPSRRMPGGAYGPQTCKPGFVWREAGPQDQVCVPPASRDQARRDNAAALSRIAN